MKTYPKMKESGIDWIGKIPEDWEISRLQFLADITTGKKDTVDNELDGEYPFYVRSPKIERISSFSCDEEAVLTAGDGVGVGKVVHYANGKFDFHQRVYKMSNFRKINGKYFYHFFKENFKKEVFKGTAKSTVDSLRRHMIQNFPVVFGSVEEQKKIVKFLEKETSKSDKELENSLKILELLKEKRQALINQTLTKGLDPSVPMKDSDVEWIGKIPEHWELRRVKNSDLLEITSGRFIENYEKGEFPVYGANGKIGNSDLHNTENVIVIGRVGYYAGSITAIFEKAWVTDNGLIVKSNSKINNDFLFYAFSNLNFNRFAQTTTQPLISQAILSQFQFCLPPIKEQKQIAEFLINNINQSDQLIQQIIKKNSKIKEFMNSLTLSVVTGKIDVREAVV